MEGTMPNWLQKRAALTPDRTALIFEGQSLSFKELYEEAYRAAGNLTANDIGKDQLIAVLLPNHIDTVVILYALQMLGTKTLILNTRLTSDELAWQLNDSGCGVLITDESSHEKTEKFSSLAVNPLKILTKTELDDISNHKPTILNEFNLNEVTTIMYTSGTTGNPKGVLQTYGNHWWSAIASALNLGLSEKDRWLCAVPIFHISGYSILMRSQIYGIGVVLHTGFDEAKVIEDLKEYQVSIMSVVSTMLTRITEKVSDGASFPDLRCMMLGGGPAPLPLLEKCLSKQIPVFQTYGMTETSSQFATLSPEYSLEKSGSAGKALFPNQIQIIGTDGEVCANGKEGEIVVKGPNVTPGYLNKPEITAEKIQDGWFYTGDIGYLDEAGFLYVLDRRSDLIISGGENIYPAEIEGTLLDQQGIEDAGVIGMDDEKWGQVPVAFLVKSLGSSLTIADIERFCRQKLAGYKVPKKFLFVNELPRNASRKLLRKTLREWFEEEPGTGEY
ncbi:o-succinylbenzoate--CoA ligase [Mesobacillus harenae]|uniref:o-succinylbenzoate--CoA ligase n=1 Tax=Mesobacillus harenae TaxID=2213203 RepID=UPI00157FF761|nr:o-succinylbenzoate--CoA ligase [Mesobacillus harenae]